VLHSSLKGRVNLHMWHVPPARAALDILLAIALLVVPVAAQRDARANLSMADADRFQEKLDAVVAHGAARPAPPPLRTTVTEGEVNAYLFYRLSGQFPAGVVEPSVSILGNGRVSGYAVVDLDVVRQSRPRSWFDPMRLLRGRLPVTATGVFRAAGGVGRLELESTNVSGVPVPKSLLQELVSYYSATPDNPNGVSLDAPFALPAGIRDIEVWAGKAVIVQ
jgi:hypothetical protein